MDEFASDPAELLSHRSLLLSHLECLGLRVNFAKSSLFPSQLISSLGAVFYSAQIRVVVAPEHVLAIQQLPSELEPLALSRHFTNAGPRGLRISSATAGPASHKAPTVMPETKGSAPCLALRTPSYQGGPGLRGSSGPLEKPPVVGMGRGSGYVLRKKGCLVR